MQKISTLKYVANLVGFTFQLQVMLLVKALVTPSLSITETYCFKPTCIKL